MIFNLKLFSDKKLEKEATVLEIKSSIIVFVLSLLNIIHKKNFTIDVNFM